MVEVGKLLKRGAPKMKTKVGKDGKTLKDKKGNAINEVVRKKGKIVYQPYEIKVLNTIDFKKSMHYNPFSYIRSEKDILKFVTASIANTKGEDSKGGEVFWVSATRSYQPEFFLFFYQKPSVVLKASQNQGF